MKGVEKIITYICIAGTLAVLVLSVDLTHSMVVFLLAGIIPGTNWSIPAADMMAATAALLTVLIFSPIYLPGVKRFILTYNKAPTQHETPKNHPAK